MLTVNPAPLTITGNSATKVLDAPNPALTFTAAGFANGDTAGALTSVPTCSTSATTTSPVGSYAVTCSGGNALNYVFSYLPGSLKILYSTAIGHAIQSPIAGDGSSVFKQGRTVPAKFSVYDANGLSIGTPGVVSSLHLTGIMSGTGIAPVQNIVDINNPDSAFRFDATAQNWIFNISTANLVVGSTYVYTVALNDGSTIQFRYGLR